MQVAAGAVGAAVVVAEIGGLHGPDGGRGRVLDPYWCYGMER